MLNKCKSIPYMQKVHNNAHQYESFMYMKIVLKISEKRNMKKQKYLGN